MIYSIAIGLYIKIFIITIECNNFISLITYHYIMLLTAICIFLEL